ncbi:MAG: hypothetical protein HPY50_06575 [Firmicutes bacterium]|nr:hypothetical protein [Bacillota bacterium]
MKICWPKGCDFAFTIVDDTEYASCGNVKPIYDLLYECGIYTTKTVWVKPPRDHFTGQCLEDAEYLGFVRDLKEKGFEIALHSIGSGSYDRNEIIAGIEEFKNLLGSYPTMQINHSTNNDSLYWGYERYVPPLKWLYQIVYGGKRAYHGSDQESEYFWGDVAKERIRYIRNHAFNGINTLKYDPRMPYRYKGKERYSNFWFSSADGDDVRVFNNLLRKDNVDALERENGACIVYTHFGKGFVNGEGTLDREFENSIRYLAGKKGWFVPANVLLDFLSDHAGGGAHVNYWYLLKMDAVWIKERVLKYLRYGI